MFDDPKKLEILRTLLRLDQDEGIPVPRGGWTELQLLRLSAAAFCAAAHRAVEAVIQNEEVEDEALEYSTAARQESLEDTFLAIRVETNDLILAMQGSGILIPPDEGD